MAYFRKDCSEVQPNFTKAAVLLATMKPALWMAYIGSVESTQCPHCRGELVLYNGGEYIISTRRGRFWACFCKSCGTSFVERAIHQGTDPLHTYYAFSLLSPTCEEFSLE